MKIKYLLLSTVMASGIAVSTYAYSDEPEQQPYMPMMGGNLVDMPMNYMQDRSMNPQMMQQMMRMRQQGGMPMMGSNRGGMPMMGSNRGGMPMMGGNRGGMPMMGGNRGDMPMMGGNQDGMPMMKMMQERHTNMDQHMQTMETRLANIEALLSKLVELQKKR